jgi:hypothetical protein
MSLFVKLSEVLLVELFASWIDQEDILKFDSALTNGDIRQSFIGLCSDDGVFTFKQTHKSNHHLKKNNWLFWTFSRGFKVDRLTFDDLSWTKWCAATALYRNDVIALLLDRCTHLEFASCFETDFVLVHQRCLNVLLKSLPRLVSFSVISMGKLNVQRMFSSANPGILQNLQYLLVTGIRQTAGVIPPLHLIEVLRGTWHNALVGVTIDCTTCHATSLSQLMIGNALSLTKIYLKSVMLSPINCSSLHCCKNLTQLFLGLSFDSSVETVQECIKALGACKQLLCFTVTNFGDNEEVGGGRFAIVCRSSPDLPSIDSTHHNFWVMEFSFVPFCLIASCLMYGGNRLKFLTLRSIQLEDIMGEHHAFVHNPTLVSIRFVSCPSLTTLRLKALVSWKSIRVLALDGCPHLTSECVSTACEANVNVRRISVYRHPTLTLVGVHKLFMAHQGAREIRCGACLLISSETSVSFKRAPESEQLQIKFGKVVDDSVSPYF